MSSKGGCLCAKNPVERGAKVPERLAEGLHAAPWGAEGGDRFPEAQVLSQKGRETGRGLRADLRWLGAERAKKTISPGRAGIKEMRNQMEWDLSARGHRRPPDVRGWALPGVT